MTCSGALAVNPASINILHKTTVIKQSDKKTFMLMFTRVLLIEFDVITVTAYAGCRLHYPILFAVLNLA